LLAFCKHKRGLHISDNKDEMHSGYVASLRCEFERKFSFIFQNFLDYACIEEVEYHFLHGSIRCFYGIDICGTGISLLVSIQERMQVLE
jgi:hypothetical protein